MGAELEIALVLSTAFLWITGTFTILSAIDRPERRARRRERRASRAGERRVLYRTAAKDSRLAKGATPPRTLRPH
jgi:hypothetical protein